MKKNITRDIIIKKNLELINKIGSSQNVSICRIARELGCNHTNIYNYFKSKEDLQIETLKELFSLVRIEEILQISADSDPRSIIENFLRHILDFAFDNKGLYKFLWIDNYNTKQLKEAIGDKGRPEFYFRKHFSLMHSELKDEKLIERILSIIHSYFHGKVLIYITGRNIPTAEEDYKKNILDTTMFLFDKMSTLGNEG